jgi:hypothetical protein
MFSVLHFRSEFIYKHVLDEPAEGDLNQPYAFDLGGTSFTLYKARLPLLSQDNPQ